jgi:hypothetical protein
MSSSEGFDARIPAGSFERGAPDEVNSILSGIVAGSSVTMYNCLIIDIQAFKHRPDPLDV